MNVQRPSTEPEQHIATFYEFSTVEDLGGLRDWLIATGTAAALSGTILIAAEGVNGTIAGRKDALTSFLDAFQERTGLALRQLKFSRTSGQPFRRFRVRIKSELVTFRQADADPRRATGRYADVDTWHRLLDDPSVRVIDTRNTYETTLGGFAPAHDPQTENFTDFADYVDRHLDSQRDTKIAMYCTGGIRCEKASSLLLARGFSEVYHLDGGILRYLEHVDPAESRWQGECYVFDERVSVTSDLKPGTHRNCAQCGWPARRGSDCPECGASP